MTIRSIKTDKISDNTKSINEILDMYLSALEEKSVLAITSKVVSICEGRVVKIGAVSKQELMKQEADYYMDSSKSKYGYSFTVTNSTLIPMAGIDESNGNGHYILWPKKPQQSANEIRKYLANRFGLAEVGVIITDSTCMPLRLGTTGISIAHSGFEALNDYTKQNDIFGRKFALTQANIAGGLAATAVLAMGEGAEQTPIVTISELDFVKFQNRDPNAEEINSLTVSIEDDLFAPFMEVVKWHNDNA